jgi:hypothetical protein
MNSTAGFILGLVGGALDFISGTSIFMGSMPGGSVMASPMGVPNIVWVDGLYILGGAVLVTTFLSVSSVMMSMKLSRALMVTYGVVMLIVGWAMSSGTALMMTPVFGYAMVVVGVLMIANGSLMKSARM